MFSLFKSVGASLTGGIAIGENQITAVLVSCRGSQYELIDAISLEDDSEQPSIETLTKIRKQLKLKTTPTTYVMGPRDYSIIQVDAPKVPDEEVKAALKWQIRDLIDIPVSDISLDTFEIPASGLDRSNKMLNVIVAKKSFINKRTALLNSADINTYSIDITEIALKNISNEHKEDSNNISLNVFILNSTIYIEISNKENLYLSRSININTEGHEFYESLALDIQRSMDHYESNYHDSDISNIEIYSGSKNKLNGFYSHALKYFSEKVKKITMEEIISGCNQIEAQDANYLPIIGAAMRAA